jgi:hypothetical protein
LVNGEVRFTNHAGHGVKIEAPWLIEATGNQPAGAVRWKLEQSKSGALPRLRLVVAPGLRYPVVVDPSWSLTGSMGTARYSHTATLLPSGQVLVAGGVDDTPVVVSSAELYDPATRTWMATGNMGVPREAHTATLLASGKVLVAAGYGTAPLSSAELYDPATGMWTPTGSLAHARQSHTATLLPSGKVLVAGGYNGTSLSSAELYDPATRIWAATGSMGTTRNGPTATLLSLGQVLVAGGYSFRYLSSAELYDPASGLWTATAGMGTARFAPTATLLPSGKVLVAGGGLGTGYLSSAELYDPGTVSQITPEETTCSQFSSGTAQTLGSVQYDVDNNNLIDQVVPQRFLYWATVTAPAGDNIFRITQTITTGNFNSFFAANGNGSNVFDSDCASLERSGSQSSDTVTVRFNAPVAGTYFIAVNFVAQSLSGEPAPSPGTTVHYDFTTRGVPDSTSGLTLVER